MFMWENGDPERVNSPRVSTPRVRRLRDAFAVCSRVCCSVLQCVADGGCIYCVRECVAVCCSVLQCVTVRYSVLQKVGTFTVCSVCCRVLRSVLQCVADGGCIYCVRECVAVSCSVLWCVSVFCMKWVHLLCVHTCVTVCCSVLQCVAVRCSALQCVAVR